MANHYYYFHADAAARGGGYSRTACGAPSNMGAGYATPGQYLAHVSCRVCLKTKTLREALAAWQDSPERAALVAKAEAQHATRERLMRRNEWAPLRCTLGRNLAIAGALTRSFHLGRVADMADGWFPNTVGDGV